MKKLKVFFITAALVLVTLGIFAGSSKYFDTYQLYGYNATTGYILLICGSITFCAEMKVGFAGSTPAIISFSTLSYGVYEYDVTTGSYLPIQLK